MKLNKIAKNNLKVVIMFLMINIGAIVIAGLKGFQNSAEILLIFMGGEIIGFWLFQNIK